MSMKQISTLAFALGLCSIVACSQPDIAGRHSFETFTDENGVTHAVTRGGPKYNEPLFTFEHVTTLIEDPEVEESMLYLTGPIHMDADGWLLVPDTGNHRVAVFDQDGRYHHSFGRQGQGPGEFEMFYMQSVTGDTVTIFDIMQMRTTIYRTNGTLISVTSHHLGPRRPSFSILLGPDGRRIKIGDPPPVYTDSRVTTDLFYERRAVVYSPEGDTLAIIDTPKVPAGRRSYVRPYGHFAFGPIYFSGWPTILYDRKQGLMMSTGMEPVVHWFDLNGRITRVITVEQEREIVTAEERDAIMQLTPEQDYGVPDEATRATARQSREMMTIPDTKDHWRWADLDDSGFIWLKAMPDFTVDEAFRELAWFVLSPDGEYLGRVETPLEHGTFSKGHFLCFIEDEETGAKTGMVYRIVPAVEGLDYPN